MTMRSARAVKIQLVAPAGPVCQPPPAISVNLATRRRQGITVAVLNVVTE